MIKFKAKEQPKASPQRKAAEQLLEQLKGTLEMEAGRGNITIGHYLTARGTTDCEAFAPKTQAGTGFYSLEGVVATGGMGAVLKAQDNNLARTVALKVMLNSAEATDQAVYSFVAEAQITGQLEHPNIVPLHDIGVAADGTIYYTMKLIEGRTLRDILKDIRDGNAETIQRFPLMKLLNIFQSVCNGIDYAHSRRVIHRDLKPDNVMVGAFGEVLVLDWGLAKVLPEPGQADTEEAGEEFSGPLPDSGGDVMATMAGQVKGTPNYMAPEQAEGRVAEIDPRSDIYALGGILYCILTTQPPITGGNLDEILSRVTAINEKNESSASPAIIAPDLYNDMAVQNPTGQPAPHCPGGRVPEALSAVTMKCLSRAREARYQTVEELQGDIAAFLGGYATRAQDANIFTLMRLLFQRNKKEVAMAGIAMAAIVAVIFGFIGKVALSEKKAKDALRDAQATLKQLQDTAPSFATVAEAELRKLQFTNAMGNVEQAISLNKSNASFHNIKGNIQTSMQLYKEAQESYNRARELDSRHTEANNNGIVLAAVTRDNSDFKKLKPESYRQLYELMRDQGRTEEAGLMFARFAASDTRIIDTFRANLTAGGIKADLLERESSGEYHLNLSGQKVTSLRALNGIPLTTLNLAGCTDITDLSPLRGMPLRQLDVSGITGISDLGALKDMALLTDLNLQGCTNVLHLAPLSEVPLRRLNLNNTRVTDLAPLKENKTLEWLDLANNRQMQNISPLTGKPLRWLAVDRTRVLDLAAVKGAPLQYLSFTYTAIRDVAPLTNMPLVTNIMSETLVRDITAFRGMRLQHLVCSNTPIQSLAPLAGMTSMRLLDLQQTGITNIAALAGLPLDVLRLNRAPIADIEPLRGSPLTVELDSSAKHASPAWNPSAEPRCNT